MSLRLGKHVRRACYSNISQLNVRLEEANNYILTIAAKNFAKSCCGHFGSLFFRHEVLTILFPRELYEYFMFFPILYTDFFIT